MYTELRFALVGAGFWAHYQLAAWGESPASVRRHLQPHAVKAEELAQQFGVAARLRRPGATALEREQPDFVDIVTDVGTHAPLVRAAAERRLPVICQKPMATTLAEAEGMVAACRKAGTPFFVHENWRWQAPIREVRHILDDGLHRPAVPRRIDMISGFPVFANQPCLQTSSSSSSPTWAATSSTSPGSSLARPTGCIARRSASTPASAARTWRRSCCE